MTTRRILHGVMGLALCVCIGSLIDTTLSHSEPCPLCGGPMATIGAMHSLSASGTSYRTTGVHRCEACDYEVIAHSRSETVRPLPMAVPR